MGNRMSAHVFRNGGGALAQIATGGISGAVITLAVPAHSRFFQQDQTLRLSTTDGTTGATANPGTVTVLSVDRALGKITCTASVTAGIATAAAGGDYISSVATTRRSTESRIWSASRRGFPSRLRPLVTASSRWTGPTT